MLLYFETCWLSPFLLVGLLRARVPGFPDRLLRCLHDRRVADGMTMWHCVRLRQLLWVVCCGALCPLHGTWRASYRGWVSVSLHDRRVAVGMTRWHCVQAKLFCGALRPLHDRWLASRICCIIVSMQACGTDHLQYDMICCVAACRTTSTIALRS
jgi:hypothetical protein